MTTRNSDERIKTGIRNLDEILCGGLPKGSLTVLAGTPGSGKTILSQQIMFQNATPQARALIFQTLSEPTAKTLKYLKTFDYFEAQRLDDESVQFVDLGSILRSDGLEKAISLLMEHVKRVQPAFVVIDSFKVFEDLARSNEELRKFTYEVAIQLMAWECTSLLLGEFSARDLEGNPLFSIMDGLILMKTRKESGERQRFMEVVKMRGTNHSRDDHSFAITSKGLDIYAPRVTIVRDPSADKFVKNNGPLRCQLGISKLDDLLGDGIPFGSSLLVSGVAGTGKTLLLLEAIYRGAKDQNQKGIFFSFEETEERILAVARGMGWDLEAEIKRGKVELIFTPQPDVQVEKHLLMMNDRIGRLGAKRVAIDSVSLFLHKVKQPELAREKIFQLATLVQKAQAIGLFATDIPYGSHKISRFGVEETVVDGIVLLTASELGFDRERFLEIYKLRNTAHLGGRHKMTIDHGGISVYPRYEKADALKPEART